MGVEPPQPGVVDLRVAEFAKPRVSTPRALVFMRLKQSVMDARVHAGCDDALNLHALARNGVFCSRRGHRRE